MPRHELIGIRKSAQRKMFFESNTRCGRSTSPSAEFASGIAEAIFLASFFFYTFCVLLESWKPGSCSSYFPMRYPFLVTLGSGVFYVFLTRLCRIEEGRTTGNRTMVSPFAPFLAALIWIFLAGSVRGSTHRVLVLMLGTALTLTLSILLGEEV